MSVAYYKQDEDNPNLVLVCPYDGSELLVSEFGERYVCEEHYHDVLSEDAITRESWNSRVLTRTQEEST